MKKNISTTSLLLSLLLFGNLNFAFSQNGTGIDGLAIGSEQELINLSLRMVNVTLFLILKMQEKVQ